MDFIGELTFGEEAMYKVILCSNILLCPWDDSS